MGVGELLVGLLALKFGSVLAFSGYQIYLFNNKK